MGETPNGKHQLCPRIITRGFLVFRHFCQTDELPATFLEILCDTKKSGARSLQKHLQNRHYYVHYVKTARSKVLEKRTIIDGTAHMARSRYKSPDFANIPEIDLRYFKHQTPEKTTFLKRLSGKVFFWTQEFPRKSRVAHPSAKKFKNVRKVIIILGDD